MAKFAADTLKAKKVAILVRRQQRLLGRPRRRSSAEAFKKLGGEIVARAALQRGRHGLPRPAHRASRPPSPDAIFVPGLLHRGRAPSPARRASSASRCRSSAATAGTRRKLCEIGGEAHRRLLLLEPLLGRRPEPGRPEVRRRLQGQVRPGARTRLAALGYDAARILADAMTRRGLAPTAPKVRDAHRRRPRTSRASPGTITHRREAQRREAGGDPQGRGRQVLLTETSSPSR